MTLIADLARCLGDRHAVGPDGVERRYLEDKTGGEAGRPAGLIRPASTEEVSRALALCHAAGQPVVIQGGRTGMTRAALARDGELILSLERMNAVESVDRTAGRMTVGGGCLLQVAQEAAADAGWRLAVDIGARGSCTIGGMIATNAGGHQVLRFGMMREHVLGIEAVLADGTVISAMSGLLKDNTGYSLKDLIAGSEGTLAVVTRAVLRLRPQPVVRETALCGFGGYRQVPETLARLEHLVPGQLTAFELMWSGFLDAASALPGNAYPFGDRHPFAVLLETEGAAAGSLEAALGTCLKEGFLADAVIAQSERDHHRLWALRDAIGPLVDRMELVQPFDVGVPLLAIGDVAEAVERRLADELPDCRPLFFGHVADGNLHLALELARESDRHRAEEIVYAAVRDAGGSVSVEHGIGMLKREWLPYSRGAAELTVMRAIRSALDPRGILNPGRIFETRA